MPELGEPPLYLALAYWGLSQESAFSRDDVAMVFAICPRRAADVMTYLIRCNLAFIQTRVVATRVVVCLWLNA
ncbi:CaiF/GrlA family transcriptional regulator [Serratia marcescens]